MKTTLSNKPFVHSALLKAILLLMVICISCQKEKASLPSPIIDTHIYTSADFVGKFTNISASWSACAYTNVGDILTLSAVGEDSVSDGTFKFHIDSKGNLSRPLQKTGDSSSVQGSGYYDYSTKRLVMSVTITANTHSSSGNDIWQKILK
jgi:hypothetical protein